MKIRNGLKVCLKAILIDLQPRDSYTTTPKNCVLALGPDFSVKHTQTERCAPVRAYVPIQPIGVFDSYDGPSPLPAKRGGNRDFDTYG